MPDIPAEAVDAAVADWNRRADAQIADSPEGHVRACLTAALPQLHERWLAEVEGALRDDNQWWAWSDRTRCAPLSEMAAGAAADYLWYVLGSGEASRD